MVDKVGTTAFGYKYFGLLLTSILLGYIGSAQNLNQHRIDSLKSRLSNSQGKKRFNILYELSGEFYANENYATALFYINEGLDQSYSLRDSSIIANVYR